MLNSRSIEPWVITGYLNFIFVCRARPEFPSEDQTTPGHMHRISLTNCSRTMGATPRSMELAAAGARLEVVLMQTGDVLYFGSGTEGRLPYRPGTESLKQFQSRCC